MVDAGSEPTYAEKIEYPPGGISYPYHLDESVSVLRDAG